MTWRIVAAILLTAASVLSNTRADEGRIPIFEPTVITAPGHYVVTRNITVSGGSIITIQSNDVTVDLNGHTLRSTTLTDDLVSVPVQLPRTRRITVRNGNLSGGARGVWANVTDIRIEKLTIQNARQGVYIEASLQAEIRSCQLLSTGHPDYGPALEVDSGGLNGVTARIVDNNILGSPGAAGIRVNGLADITGNVVTGFDLAGLELIGVPATGNGSLVERNSFDWAGTLVINSPSVTFQNNRVVQSLSAGCALSVLSSGNAILDNVLRGSACGVQVDGSYNEIRGNQASGTDGVIVNGARNLLESNLLDGTGPPGSCGIRFAAINPDNVYRNNLVYGAIRICNVGRDGGGNL